MTRGRTKIVAAYSIEQDGVYFYDTLIKGADAASFEILSEDFARDAAAVYVQRARYADGDPASFEILSPPEHYPTLYARDRRHVYRTNLPAIVKHLNGAEFDMLDRHYGCDRALVYSFDADRVLKNVAPQDFRPLKDGYGVAADASNPLGAGRVFYRGKKVDRAHAGTFRVIGPGMGADARAVFWNHVEVDDVQPVDIEAIGGNYFRTLDRVLYQIKPLQGADPASLVVLSDDYGRDRRSVFFRHLMIADADVDTFAVLDAFYSKDARRVYFCNQAIADADPLTFHVIGRTGGDRFRVYEGADGAERIAQPADEEIPSDALQTLARRLTAKRIAILFPVLDEVQSNDSWEEIQTAPSIGSLEPHRLTTTP